MIFIAHSGYLTLLVRAENNEEALHIATEVAEQYDRKNKVTVEYIKPDGPSDILFEKAS